MRDIAENLNLKVLDNFGNKKKVPYVYTLRMLHHLILYKIYLLNFLVS